MAATSSRRQHAGGAERLGPRHAAGDVVLEERAIEAEGDAEIEGRRIGGRLEPAVPERRHEPPPLRSESRSSLSSCRRAAGTRPGPPCPATARPRWPRTASRAPWPAGRRGRSPGSYRRRPACRRLPGRRAPSMATPRIWACPGPVRSSTSCCTWSARVRYSDRASGAWRPHAPLDHARWRTAAPAPGTPRRGRPSRAAARGCRATASPA